MQIQQRLTNEVGILRLAGRLTVNDQPGLLQQAVAELVQKGARHVLLDLGGVRYIDSTRLGELIAVHVLLGGRGGRLALVATPPRVLELLVLSNLAGTFERFDSLDAAEATFTATPA